MPRFKKLDRDIDNDILIVGGGICGIMCAYMLDALGVDYTLIEAETVCGGVTCNTTAKITSQHGLIYSDLIKKFGVEKAKLYLEANESAIQRYRELCKNIDCDFEDKDSYVYSLDDEEKIREEISALSKLNYKAEFVKELPLPFKVAGAVKFKNQAQFNPLKFAKNICENLNIYENTKLLELVGTKAVTSGGTVNAKKIIIATHFPFLNKHGGYFIKMYQRRSYVIAVKNAPNPDGMFIDEATDGLSFRTYKDLLLIGGGGHRTGKKGGNWRELRDFTAKYYKNCPEKYYWATQDCMTLDKVAYIGEYSSGTQNLYVATGFNKWGMTSSMVAACILSDLVQGKENKYSSVFSPSRSILHPQLISNMFSAIGGLLTPSLKRCPHLGCALKWNPQERSWDCPCHGSRFTENGKLINNPATDDLKTK